MKNLISILLLSIIIAGCSALTGSDDQLNADYYDVYQVGQQYPFDVKYTIDGSTNTISVDSAMVHSEDWNPHRLRIDAQNESNPTMQVINTGDKSIMLNASINSDNSDSPLGTAGGQLLPGLAFTVERGTVSR